MSAAAAIYNRLSTTSEITALVGNRIEPEFSAGPDYPRILYTIDEETAVRSHDGYAGLTSATVTISLLSSTKSQALALADLVFGVLESQGGTWGGVKVRRCFFQGQDESVVTAAELGLSHNVYEVDAQYVVWFKGP